MTQELKQQCCNAVSSQGCSTPIENATEAMSPPAAPTNPHDTKMESEKHKPGAADSYINLGDVVDGDGFPGDLDTAVGTGGGGGSEGDADKGEGGGDAGKTDGNPTEAIKWKWNGKLVEVKSNARTIKIFNIKDRSKFSFPSKGWSQADDLPLRVTPTKMVVEGVPDQPSTMVDMRIKHTQMGLDMLVPGDARVTHFQVEPRQKEEEPQGDKVEPVPEPGKEPAAVIGANSSRVATDDEATAGEVTQRNEDSSEFGGAGTATQGRPCYSTAQGDAAAMQCQQYCQNCSKLGKSPNGDVQFWSSNYEDDGGDRHDQSGHSQGGAGGSDDEANDGEGTGEDGAGGGGGAYAQKGGDARNAYFQVQLGPQEPEEEEHTDTGSDIPNYGPEREHVYGASGQEGRERDGQSALLLRNFKARKKSLPRPTQCQNLKHMCKRLMAHVLRVRLLTTKPRVCQPCPLSRTSPTSRPKSGAV